MRVIWGLMVALAIAQVITAVLYARKSRRKSDSLFVKKVPNEFKLQDSKPMNKTEKFYAISFGKTGL